nr:glucose-methanol-choline oxidoreductase, FAD/NAD(P)-binding domain protein [Tanacetum cinerariifolium]
EDACFHSKRICIKTTLAENIFESFKIIVNGKVYWVRAIEVSGWAPDFVKEDEDENETDDDNLEEGLNEVNDELRKEKIVGDVTDDEEIPVAIFDQEDSDSREFEEGMNEVDSDVREKVSMQRSKEETHGSTCSGHFKNVEFTRSGGSFLNFMDELMRQTMGYKMEGCIKKYRIAIFDQEDSDSSKKVPHCDGQDDAHSSDSFNLCDLLKKKKKHDDGNGDQRSEDTLKFPPGFTPKDDINVYSKSLNKSEGEFEEGMNEELAHVKSDANISILLFSDEASTITSDNDARNQASEVKTKVLVDASEVETKVLVDGKQDDAQVVKVVGVAVEQNNDEPNVLKGNGVTGVGCLNDKHIKKKKIKAEIQRRIWNPGIKINFFRHQLEDKVIFEGVESVTPVQEDGRPERTKREKSKPLWHKDYGVLREVVTTCERSQVRVSPWGFSFKVGICEVLHHRCVDSGADMDYLLGRLLPRARGLKFESLRGGFPSRWESVRFYIIDASIRGLT